MSRTLLIVSRVDDTRPGRLLLEQRQFDSPSALGAFLIGYRAAPGVQYDVYTLPPSALEPEKPTHRARFGERERAMGWAAEALADAINATPRTDGTTATHEYVELDEGNAPLDYLADLEARVGVNVDEARAFYNLATCADDEFQDLYWSVTGRYPRALK